MFKVILHKYGLSGLVIQQKSDCFSGLNFFFLKEPFVVLCRFTQFTLDRGGEGRQWIKDQSQMLL